MNRLDQDQGRSIYLVAGNYGIAEVKAFVAGKETVRR